MRQITKRQLTPFRSAKGEKLEVKLLQDRYFADGFCWGKCWGGGECGYEAKRFGASTLEELESQILSAIKDGSIDTGMGFEKVLGAKMKIYRRFDIVLKGTKGFNGAYRKIMFADEDECFGELSEEANDALSESLLYHHI